MPTKRNDALPLDRDVALMALLVTVLVAVAAVGAALVNAAALTTGLVTGTWAWPPAMNWPQTAMYLLFTAGSANQHVPQPWGGAVTGYLPVFWGVFAGHLAVLTTIGLGGGLRGWHRLAPTDPGHATRTEIRRNLSEKAARRSAEWTRGDLTPQQRRHAAPSEVGVPIHRGPHRQPLYTSLETPSGEVAPTRSGKTRTDLVHKALAAPGALIASTTKDDLAEWCLLACTRRPGAGPVWLIDATGTLDWPAKPGWSPITGCADPAVALRRATTLISASSLGLDDIGGNDKVFRGRATIVLQAYLLAAALDHRGVDDLVGWAITKPLDQEPADLLRTRHPQLAHNLRSEIQMVAETSDAVWMSVRRALEPFMNPDVRAFATPSPGNELDIDDLLTQRGSLFIIAGQHQAPQAQPVLTALVEQILTTAQDRALQQQRRRLEPPVTAILDELYEGTPIPRLPGLIADSAGRGVLIHWSAQSRAQLDEAYGEHGRKQLIDNTLTLSIFPGLKDDQTLDWLSTLAGQHRRRTYQHYSDGMLTPGRGSTGIETVPTYRAGDIRTLERGRVLILHANLRPILAHARDITTRGDWAQLDADTRTLRNGPIRVDHRGYRVIDATYP
ncbi:type IV secretory system conjugative DNA transfer family protein [Sciscionella marina]|uniref:type IV secretory system conjugative DNA transfer family protein n=1 Tax=Sciscionella marina TaxID=508770 RepID=UPI000372BA2A|nr:TraM recognition domain-containing protein [Sciscionella marina]